MSPGGHLVTTAIACAGTTALTGSWAATAAVAAGGFFIDLDHVADYVLLERDRPLTPDAFLRHYIEGRTRYAVLLLHSYELGLHRDRKHIYCSCNAAAYHTLYRSMEPMQELHPNSTRDSVTMNLNVLGGRESVSQGGEHLAEAGSLRTKTVQTKGLFNFMELPAEIRVNVRGLEQYQPLTL